MPWASHLEGIDGLNSWAQAGAWGATYLAVKYLTPNPGSGSKTMSRYMGQMRRKQQRMLTDHTTERSYGTYAVYQEKSRPWPYVIYKVLKDLPKYNSLISNKANFSVPVSAQAQGVIESYFNYNDLNYLLGKVVLQEPPTTGTSTTTTTDMFVEKCHGELMFTNSTYAASVRLFVAFVQPRRDTVAADDPSQSWHNGMGDQAAASADLVVGITPFMSTRFTQLYKVLRVTDTILTAGATEIIKIDLQRRRKINGELLAAMDDGSVDLMRGWSTVCFIWAYGLPINDAAGTAPTTSACKLLITSLKDYTFSYVMNNLAYTSITNTFAGLTANANTMDPLTGNAVGTNTL